MDVLDVLNNILPIIFFIFVGVFFFIIGLCINKRTKVVIRGTPSVVPSSSVLVNVYGGGQPAAAEEAARAGGGAANGGGGGSGGGSKVVSDGSKVGAKIVTISIDGITGKVNTTTTTTAATLYSSNNGSADKCGICKKAILLEPASVNGGVRANGDGGGNDDGVGSGATGGVGGGGSHAK
ncbi:PREDICTED: loricrin-like [Nicotiana attenuata]|uniref:loricrin-like n=1 Tax=Nicotiana attenuata TaxID=49451 RepID=UPI000904EB0A|nr:PREDICTED: loricrin-like [Nicotiana attenuata]